MSTTDNPASRELGFCPCCGYQTLSEGEPGSGDVCPVCRWTDDASQFENPTQVTDSNPISLQEARVNFEAYGASVEEAVEATRDPDDDARDPNWPYDR